MTNDYTWEARDTLRRNLDSCIRAVLYDRREMEAVRAACATGWNRDWGDFEQAIRARVMSGAPMTEVGPDGTGRFAAGLLPAFGDLVFVRPFIEAVIRRAASDRRELPKVFSAEGRQ